jgi:GTP cyclohydrolase I
MRSSLDVDVRPKLARMTEHYRGLIGSIGENPEREGLVDTPSRAAKAMMFFTKGYEDSVRRYIFLPSADYKVVCRRP